MSEIEKHGLSVPQDISAVGYDGIHLSELLRPKLTTYRQNAEEIGKVSVIKLIERIEQPDMDKEEHIIIKGSLQLGDTVRRIEE